LEILERRYAGSRQQAVTLPVADSDETFRVRRIYCVGRNYVAHVREMKEADERDPPFFFQKPADAIVPDGAVVPYPPQTADYQHEVELVIAIGEDGRDIPVEAALGHVYGYAVGLDMTRRDRQRDSKDRGLPWEAGKSFDHSAPCGPLHAARRVGHPARGRIALYVNGELRQQGDIADMIWSVAEIVSRLSASYALASGDLIFTGTPAGVGAVRPGDRLRGEIDGLGSLAVTIGPPEE
jgi:fumarylpyruvate hydrolase